MVSAYSFPFPTRRQITGDEWKENLVTLLCRTFYWHGLGPLVSLEGNQYRLLLTDHLDLVRKHFYSDGSGLVQDDSAPVNMPVQAQRMVSWAWNWCKLNTMAAITRSHTNWTPMRAFWVMSNVYISRELYNLCWRVLQLFWWLMVTQSLTKTRKTLLIPLIHHPFVHDHTLSVSIQYIVMMNMTRCLLTVPLVSQLRTILYISIRILRISSAR